MARRRKKAAAPAVTPEPAATTEPTAPAAEPVKPEPKRKKPKATKDVARGREILLAARSLALRVVPEHATVIEAACVATEAAAAGSVEAGQLDEALRQYVYGGVPMPAALDFAGVDPKLVPRPQETALKEP